MTARPDPTAQINAQINALSVSINSARTDLANAATLVPEQRYGVYRPLFTDATTGLVSPSGLSVASGGGLIASSAGVAGTAFIELPATVDYTKPWRCAALFQCDSASDANNVVVTLGHGAASGVANASSRGLVAQVQGGFVSASSGGNNALFQIMPTSGSGAKYWVGAASDGVQVTVFAMPYSHGGMGEFTYTTGGTAGDYTRVYPYTQKGFDGSFDQFQYQSRIKISNASVNVRVLGVYFNMAGTFESSGEIVESKGYAGGGNALMQPPAVFAPTYSPGWDSAYIRVPGTYDGRTPVDLIYCDHPNASAALVHARLSDSPDAGAMFATLANNYSLAYRNGVYPEVFSGALNSPWAGPTGLAKRKEMIDDLKTRFPMIRHVYWLGMSMGFLDGLRMHMLYPTLLRGLIGISGVTNLTYAHNSEGFGSVIETGWGSSNFAADIAPYDPSLNMSSFTGIPMTLWHSTGDTTINYTQHALNFKNGVNALGGSVSLNAITGTGHLTDAGLYSASGITTFLAAN